MLFFQRDMGCRGKIIKLISLGEFKKKKKRKRIKKTLTYFMGLPALAGCRGSAVLPAEFEFTFNLLYIYIYLNYMRKIYLFMQ